jgi:hypothetical protein
MCFSATTTLSSAVNRWPATGFGIIAIDAFELDGECASMRNTRSARKEESPGDVFAAPHQVDVVCTNAKCSILEKLNGILTFFACHTILSIVFIAMGDVACSSHITMLYEFSYYHRDVVSLRITSSIFCAVLSDLVCIGTQS